MRGGSAHPGIFSSMNQQTFDCAAILFDLDGVLVDSTRSVERFWRAWAQENGLDPEHAVSVAHGRRTVETLRILIPELDAEQEAMTLEKREAHQTEGVTVMPGAAELLVSIPRECWCVVTSGTRYLATRRLAIAKLPCPNVLVTADDVRQGKPSPEPYLKAAELLGLKARQCVVIEDAPAGIRAACSAGMKAIGLTTTYGAPELSEADAIISKLAELTPRVSGRQIEIHLAIDPLS